VFIFVGRLDPYKQPLDLVPLLQAAPDWYAIIIGRGSLGDELTRRLTDAGLLDRCRLIPQLPNEQVHVYYHACDAFVNLNPNEIFGMSLLEAMYAGCPPVARHAPGPDLIIENGISGLLCSTVPELAAALDQIGARGFNMECIKSRPLPHVPFEYYFYVQIVCPAGSTGAGCQTLLDTLTSVCSTLRLLGAFTLDSTEK